MTFVEKEMGARRPPTLEDARCPERVIAERESHVLYFVVRTSLEG